MRRFFLLVLCLGLLGLGACRAPMGEENGSPALPGLEPEGALSPQTALSPPAPTGPQRLLWISQFDLDEVYLEKGRQRPVADFSARITQILARAKSLGFQACLVQVHPYGDSFYRSQVFPWSRYVTGAYGREAGYDPFLVLTQQARALGLEIHAWINPFRLMKPQEMQALPSEHFLRQWAADGSGRVVEVEGRCYFDPAFVQVQERLVQVVQELCQSYPIAGVHMDDYFYPTTDPSFDALSYAAYRAGGGSLELGDFRRQNVSRVVQALYRAVKECSPELRFGISPAGNLQSVMEDQYADVALWCREPGYVDYLCPQVYFGFEHQRFPFDGVCRSWMELPRDPGVALWVGVTFTKVGLEKDPYAGTGAGEWARNTDVLKRSVEFVYAQPRITGLCVFSLSYLLDPLTFETPPGSQAELKNFLQVF